MGPEEACVAQSNGPESRSSRASRTRLSPLPRCYHAPATFPVKRGSRSVIERAAILDVTTRKHATLYVFRITPRPGLEGAEVMMHRRAPAVHGTASATCFPK